MGFICETYVDNKGSKSYHLASLGISGAGNVSLLYD